MANVLNRTTMAYLEYVNTPDYPETDWLINPDLSAVQGTDPRYWVIDTTYSTVNEIVSYDGNGDPVYGDVQVPSYTVRVMTTEEQTAYDVLHPIVLPFTGTLSDGTPAYMFNGVPISINTTTVEFAIKTKGSKNFLVPASNTGNVTVLCAKNAMIKSASIHVDADASFSVILRTQAGDLHTIECQSKDTFADLSNLLTAGDALMCYLSASVDVANPRINLQLAQRS